jgi:hypothetical protein
MNWLFISISDCVGTVEDWRRSQFTSITGASNACSIASGRLRRT